MCPRLGDSAGVEDEYQVGVFDSADLVRDHDLSRSDRPQVGIDGCFGECVERTGRFVEQEDVRPPCEAQARAMRWRCPPDRDAPESVRIVSYPIGIAAMSSWMQASRAARFDVVGRQRRIGQCDVVTDRHSEELRVLGDDSELGAYGAEG